MVYRIHYQLYSHYRDRDNYPTNTHGDDGVFEFDTLDHIELQIKEKIAALIDDTGIIAIDLGRGRNRTPEAIAKLITTRDLFRNVEEYYSMVFTSPLYLYDPTLPKVDADQLFGDVIFNDLMKQIPKFTK